MNGNTFIHLKWTEPSGYNCDSIDAFCHFKNIFADQIYSKANTVCCVLYDNDGQYIYWLAVDRIKQQSHCDSINASCGSGAVDRRLDLP